MCRIHNREEAARCLKQLRQQSGLTQEQVAERLCVSPISVYNWERWYRFRYPYHAHRLFRLYGVNEELRKELDYFLLYDRRG